MRQFSWSFFYFPDGNKSGFFCNTNFVWSLTFFSLFTWTVCNLLAIDSSVEYFRHINFIIKYHSNDCNSGYERCIIGLSDWNGSRSISSSGAMKTQNICQSYRILKCFSYPLVPCSFLDFSEGLFLLGKKFQEIFSKIVPLFNIMNSHLFHWQPFCFHMFDKLI